MYLLFRHSQSAPLQTLAPTKPREPYREITHLGREREKKKKNNTPFPPLTLQETHEQRSLQVSPPLLPLSLSPSLPLCVRHHVIEAFNCELYHKNTPPRNLREKMRGKDSLKSWNFSLLEWRCWKCSSTAVPPRASRHSQASPWPRDEL